MDLLRRVQKAPERNQLELEPGTQLPAPRPLPAPAAAVAKALVSSCPRLGAEHALGTCHEAVGNFATVSGRAEQEEGASPQSPSLPPRHFCSRHGRHEEASRVSAASMIANGTDRVLGPLSLDWISSKPQRQQFISLTPRRVSWCGPSHNIVGIGSRCSQAILQRLQGGPKNTTALEASSLAP